MSASTPRNHTALPEVPEHLRDDPEIKGRLIHIADQRVQIDAVRAEINTYEARLRTAQAVSRAIQWGINPEVGRVVDRHSDDGQLSAMVDRCEFAAQLAEDRGDAATAAVFRNLAGRLADLAMDGDA